MKTQSDDCMWQKPILSVEGQLAFWDAQSEVYEGADMTVDNQKEMEVVIQCCREIQFNDLVTLGGAVGCRDPKMILDDLHDRGSDRNPVVFYNDLSGEQVRKAKESVLKPYTDNGLTIHYLPGEIIKVCENIPHANRRLIIGVYDCHSFFNALPSDGYPTCGFDEYLKNSAILGSDFLMDWVRLNSENRMESYGVRAKVSVPDDTNKRDWIKNQINVSTSQITALQIIGRMENNPGFFLSHWYTQSGFMGLLRSVFPSDSYNIRMETFAKGMVYIVDPVAVPYTGIVTILNNVVGNVLPDDQYKTLSAIKRIITL